jgi:2',3'-cyclic-nucleotide 2'-phosphodiesterase (5'-nucleotidase family)
MYSSSGAITTTTTIDPTLPFGDINLIVLTDVHSWVGGHGDNEGPNNLDVSYGDVVSFYERLKEHCGSISGTDNECGDLWLVQNGDWIDGTGLATDGDPSALVPLLEKVPFDVLNTGNHELYQDSVIAEMRKPGGFLQWWGPRHLASNVYMNTNTNANTNTKEPMSNRYHVLKGKSSTVLVFGFIYNLPNPSDLVVVQTVEEAVQEPWFQDVLTDETIGYDAILVMLHAGHDDPSVEILRKEIRRVTTSSSGIDAERNLPIQFIAGHTHYRRYAVADSQSTIVEAGRYMDTVGWVSFPNSETIRKEKENETHNNNNNNNRRKLRVPMAYDYGNFTDFNSSMGSSNITTTTVLPTKSETITDNSITNLFHHVFLDANKATLREALGIPAPVAATSYDDGFQTPLGKEMSAFIKDTRESLGLTLNIGCAPNDYLLNRSMVHEDSLWRLYRDEVGPHVLATINFVGDTTTTTTATLATTSVSSSDRRALFLSQDSWRYGLYGGDHLTYDDILVVSPFNEPIYRVSVLPCSSVLQLNESMNADATDSFYSSLPAWILSGQKDSKNLHDGSGANIDASGDANANADCELYVNHFGLSRVQTGLQAMASRAENETLLWDPIETNLTTTSIWFSFVENRWQCRGHSGMEDGDGIGSGEHKPGNNKWGSSKPSSNNQDANNSGTVYGNGSVVMVILSVSIAILCILIASPCVIRKRRGRSANGYDGVMLKSSGKSDDGSNAPGILCDGDYCDEIDGDERFSESDDSTAYEGEPSIRIV